MVRLRARCRWSATVAWNGLGIGVPGLPSSPVRGVERQLVLIAVAGAMGLVVDSLLMSSGVLRYPNWTLVAWLAPPWDVVLWLQFATILPFCLRWLSRRYWLCSLAGLVGGPLAFYAGERFGAVTFLPPRWPHYAALAVVWSVAFPILVWVSDRLIVIPGVGDRYRWLSRG